MTVVAMAALAVLFLILMPDDAGAGWMWALVLWGVLTFFVFLAAL